MQNGDLGTQSTETEDVVTPAKESENLVPVETFPSADATESTPIATTETVTVTAESTSQLSGPARLRSRIESVWHRLREKRREAATVVVLVVIAVVWFDSGSSGTGSASNSPIELDDFDTVLSDFETVGDVQGMRESADPFESSSQSSFESGLYFPPSEDPFPSDTFSAKNASGDSGRSTRTATARDPETASAFNASSTQTSADYGSERQQPRKVKFAGRIQPAN